jgi:hypothetical protein
MIKSGDAIEAEKEAAGGAGEVKSLLSQIDCVL